MINILVELFLKIEADFFLVLLESIESTTADEKVVEPREEFDSELSTSPSLSPVTGDVKVLLQSGSPSLHRAGVNPVVAFIAPVFLTCYKFVDIHVV